VYPDANIGCPTGATSGFDVVDIDPRNNGVESFARLLEDHGPLPRGPQSKTGSGGAHLLIRATGSTKSRDRAFGAGYPGIDVKGEKGSVVLPPSTHVEGVYRWKVGLHEAELPEWPDSLLSLMTAARSERSRQDDFAGAPHGNRNEACAQLVGRLLAAGASAGEALNIMVAWGFLCDPPLLRAEVAKVVESIAQAEAAKSQGGVVLVPLDWTREEEDDKPEMLFEPQIPKGARLWGVGPAGSAKSMYGLWVAARLSREGIRVVYLSGENPSGEDRRRLRRLRADPQFLRFFDRRNGVDLAHAGWREAVFREAQGAGLVVADTLTALWSGDENDNAAIVAFDRECLVPLVDRTGVSVLVLHHPGHTSPQFRRPDVELARGAVSMGQKADLVLAFESASDKRFRVRSSKGRLGPQFDGLVVHYEIADLDDGSLDLREVASDPTTSSQDPVDEVVEQMVAAISDSGSLTTNELKARVPRRDLHSQALARLREDSRVSVSDAEMVDTPGGPQRANVWRLRSFDDLMAATSIGGV
jgi:hypothetical protein